MDVSRSAANGRPPHDASAPEVLDSSLRFGWQLIRHLVGKASARFDLSHHDREDLEQTVWREYTRRSVHFDPAKGEWKAFSTVVIRNSLKSEIDRICRNNQTAPVPLEDENEIPASSRSEQELREMELDVREFLDRLSPEERRLVEPLFSMNVSEAARHLGLPRSTFRDRLKRIREERGAESLRDHL